VGLIASSGKWTPIDLSPRWFISKNNNGLIGSGKKQSIPEHYYARREEEWALADKIVVNSEFSRKALIHQNVAPEKIAVIPLAYEAPQYQPLPSNPVEPTTRPLRVLWLGQVNLRKGIQYLCSAAKLLKGSQIQIDVVGPVYISEQAMKSAPENVVFHGSVPRSEIAEWYRQADVFVLPTISDGFAITQLEAMAHGLPVISTPNCGEVVSNGRDGLIVPAGNAEAIAIALDSLSSDRPLLRKMSHQATKTVRRFSIANLIQNLESLEQNLIRPTSQPKSAGSHEILP
jgi:glycosyltransferase involved in cell wall biosynthesis